MFAAAVAGRVLRPLVSLARTAATISDTELNQRIAVTGRDEASQIAAAFNEMLSRLERTFETQRQSSTTPATSCARTHSDDHSASGAGLGLAIVKAIAEGARRDGEGDITTRLGCPLRDHHPDRP